MNISAKRMRLLKHLTSNWEGDPLDEGGLVRIINPEGRRPPLIWCFNSEHEFPILADGLGQDQPVIGLRSLHMVAPNDGTRFRNDELIASEYTNALLSSLDLNDCHVGGNCQGAWVAMHIASNLLLMGKRIGALITMEAESPIPFPGRVGLIFGASSEDYNPFLQGKSPEKKWRTLFADVAVEIIPGSHGQYFENENCPFLCEAITRIIDRPAETDAAASLPVEISLDLVAPPTSVKAGTKTPIQVRPITKTTADTNDIGQVTICFLWVSGEHGTLDGETTESFAVDAGRDAETMTVFIEAPEKAGPWDLHIFACRENAGPVSWAANLAPKCRLQVEW